MELLQIKYFKCVAKYCNITKASQELHISQPSLSITIKRLEDELGVSLFNRVGKKLELNTFGKHFLKHANSILNEIENAKSELLEVYGLRNTHISLSASTSFFLIGLLKNFLTFNPTVTMTQSIKDGTKILDALRDRSVDFAITSPPIDEADIESIDLLEEELVVVLPNSHRLADKGSIYLEELKDDNFLELTETFFFRSTVKKLFENANFTPNVIFECDSTLISELLSLKRGVAIVPLCACISGNDSEYSILRLKDKDNTRKICISYKKGRHFSELSNNFLNFAIDYYKTSWYTLQNTNNKKILSLFQ